MTTATVTDVNRNHWPINRQLQRPNVILWEWEPRPARRHPYAAARVVVAIHHTGTSTGFQCALALRCPPVSRGKILVRP